METLYSVLLPLRFDKTFTYKYTGEDDLSHGQLVKVSFRSSEIIGVIIGKTNESHGKLKEISKVYRGLKFEENLIKFIDRVANYNMVPRGLILKMVLGGNKHFDKEVKIEIGAHKTISNLVSLRDEQQSALALIQEKLSQNQYSSILLEGITGSGKTEVYLKAAEELINQGKQTLVLLPEIVLTTQLMQRFEERLGFKPVQWHSSISPKEKKIYWEAVFSGKAKFIVGARSALFLPYKNLKLIIIDEEHDQSYKQEEGVIYNARDMAILRASLEKIPIILSSATPSLESIYNVKQNKSEKVYLSSRHGTATLPEIKIVDLNKEQLNKGEWISPTLKSHLEEILASKQQSLLFLNRRGYAPITYCSNCKTKVECPDCNFWMVEHKKKGILQCHYCGYSIEKVQKCTTCGSTEKVFALGPGVERIEEEIKKLLPDARTVLFTSDTIENHKEAGKIIDAIMNNEVDIVIGTQMAAKGLHFPKLNLVGIIEADKNLVGGDIRTLERTYQLLHQVSGRAGREVEKGVVIIQTYEPESALLKNLSNGNSEKFYEAELNDRMEADMPPYSKLAIITLQSISEQACLDTADQIAVHIPETGNITVLGPSPAPIFMLRKRYRYRFIVKSAKNINMQKIIAHWLSKINLSPRVKLKIDIDPYSFL
ncbi:replication restart helicase PriA [Candidatus Jidaibacter acanthamoebae]|nr:primosomal protein N' [Candidatus Jidaibacter acanthamoeba]